MRIIYPGGCIEVVDQSWGNPPPMVVDFPRTKIKGGIKRIYVLYSADVTKGADLRIGVKTSKTFNMSVNKYEGKESVGIEYAKNFIDYCRNNEIEAVFMFIPYSKQENLYEWKDA